MRAVYHHIVRRRSPCFRKLNMYSYRLLLRTAAKESGEEKVTEQSLNMSVGSNGFLIM